MIYIIGVCSLFQAAHVALMNNPANSELARLYLRTLSRIRQKNQIRLLVDPALTKHPLHTLLCRSLLFSS